MSMSSCTLVLTASVHTFMHEMGSIVGIAANSCMTP